METLSVRAENSATMAAECPFVYVVGLLGVHWRPAILWTIAGGTVSYNAIRRAIPPITDKMLASDLSALVERGLVVRHQLSLKPRRSRYELTARGASLIPVLRSMQEWVDQDLLGASAHSHSDDNECSSAGAATTRAQVVQAGNSRAGTKLRPTAASAPSSKTGGISLP